MKNRPFRARLGFAFEGLKDAWRRERSFRSQVVIALAAVFATAALRPGFLWSAAIALSIALVLAIELINSAVEWMIDELHPGVSPEVKRIKDGTAAAVLVASVGALAVGVLMIIDLLTP